MPSVIRIKEHNRQVVLDSVINAPDGHVITFERKIVLKDKLLRGMAIELVRKLKVDWVVRINALNRSVAQNKLMWLILTDLSRAEPMELKKTPEQWKHLALHMCKHQCQFEMDLNGQPFAVGMSTSKLKVGEMADLITWIYAFGNENKVQWSEPIPDEYLTQAKAA